MIFCFKRITCQGIKMVFSLSHILKMTELAKRGQNSKSLIANVLDLNDDYKHQGLLSPLHQFSSTIQQQPSDRANGNGYIRSPISPNPDENSYSMPNSISMPAFQTNSSNIRHRIRNRKSTEVTKRAIAEKLANKELKAILREVRVITNKVTDEVFLAKYIVRNFQLRFSYQMLKLHLYHN